MKLLRLLIGVLLALPSAGLRAGEAEDRTRLVHAQVKLDTDFWHALLGHHAEMKVDYDNQPSTAMAHLFNYSGKPCPAQNWVRAVRRTAHGDVTP